MVEYLSMVEHWSMVKEHGVWWSMVYGGALVYGEGAWCMVKKQGLQCNSHEFVMSVFKLIPMLQVHHGSIRRRS